jgi:putative DNA primase/helicase
MEKKLKGGPNMGMDFNDLEKERGLKAVADQVKPVIDAAKGEPYGSYIVRHNGVYQQKTDDNDKIVETYLCTRLNPKGIARTADSNRFSLVLELTDLDGKVKIWTLPQEDIYRSGGDEARVQFVSMGGAFGPGTRERVAFVDFMKSICRYSRNLPRIILAERAGWLFKNDQYAYVQPDHTIGRIGKEDIVLPNPGDGAPDHAISGTLEEWQHQISAYCAGNSRLVFAVSVALAAPLLFLTGGEGGGFNLVGASSSGKTTAQHAGVSVAGSPEGHLKSCDNTANAFESTAAQHSDGTLFMDELGQAPREQAGQVVYKLSGGTGRGRADQSGNARGRRQWRILFFTSGETDLASLMAGANRRSYTGQELRLADIEADAGAGKGIFEDCHGFENPADLADHLRHNARRYHGVALNQYLQKLVAEMNTPTERAARLQWIADQEQAFIRQAVPPGASGQVHRVAKRFALVAAGGELGILYGITAWNTGEAMSAALKCFDAWLSRRGTAGHGEVEQLLRQVSEFFERHGESRFTDWGSKIKFPTPNRAGFRRSVEVGLDEDNRLTEYFVLPAVFRTEVCHGFEPRWCAQVLVEKNLISVGGDNKPQSVHRLPGMGSTRCYHFHAQTESENLDSEENIEVPF